MFFMCYWCWYKLSVCVCVCVYIYIYIYGIPTMNMNMKENVDALGDPGIIVSILHCKTGI
jgi:hypothetical protein